jgi:hypothetical protein
MALWLAESFCLPILRKWLLRGEVENPGCKGVIGLTDY